MTCKVNFYGALAGERHPEQFSNVSKLLWPIFALSVSDQPAFPTHDFTRADCPEILTPI